MVLYSAARIEYNLCGSVIQKHTHTYPLTQMITWEASSLLGQGFYFTVHYSIISGHILLYTNWNRNREPGNADIGTVEPGNDFSGSGILPISIVFLLSSLTDINLLL